jgi:hypothetical protein
MKEVLNFNACSYLDSSAAPLQIDQSEINSAFLPQGKKLYFNRTRLDRWLQLGTVNRLRTEIEI